MMESYSPSKAFLGVRFVLYGFDPPNKSKVRSVLLDGGGEDAGRYGESCTHVIVDNIVYDDPVCVNAIKDGKTLVTGLWVDHSFDLGMPVDATSVMYRPPRDLNGVPGAKALTVCLTGYQRQDREDIMTMVRLMGAHFSKPLNANKVTHLICYKFEGEKYELANRTKTVKLVNHRWLEDCLRDWKLLPEENYCQSGHELAMMEAEAKDSEEDVEDVKVYQTNHQNVNKSPQNLKTGTPKAYGLPNSSQKGPSMAHNLSEPEGQLSSVNPVQMLTTPSKKNKSGHASGIDSIFVSGLSGYMGIGTAHDAKSAELPDPLETTPNSTKKTDSLQFISRSVGRPSHSGSKFVAPSCSKKTPQQSPSSIFSGVSVNARSSPKLKLGESVDNASASVGYASNPAEPSAEISRKGNGSLNEGVSSGEKRKTNVSGSSSKSQKMSHSGQPCASGSPSISDRTKGLNPTSVVDDLPRINSRTPLDSDGFLLQGVGLSAAQNLHTMVLETNSPKCEDVCTPKVTPLRKLTLESGHVENTVKMVTESSLQRPGASSLAGPREVRDDGVENSVQLVSAAQEPPNQHQDEEVPCPYNNLQTSGALTKLGMLEEGNDSLTAKPIRKKKVTKKTLGSRPKLNTSSDQKGSIYVNITPPNEPEVDQSPLEGGVDHEKIFNGNEIQTPSVTADSQAMVDGHANGVPKLGDSSENKTSFGDEETEGPGEDDFVDELNAKKNAAKVDSPKKTENKSEMKSEVIPLVSNDSATACVNVGKAGKNLLKKNKSTSKADDIKEKRSKGKSTSKADDIKEKRSKGKKQEFIETQKNTVNNAVITDSEKVLDRKEAGKNKKEKAAKKREPSSSGKRKKQTLSGSKSKYSMDVEKENTPVSDGEENVCQGKNRGVKTDITSDTKPLKHNQKVVISDSARLVPKKMITEPALFILSGHRLQRKEFQQVIRRLKGKFCRDSHNWSYQATHFIAPDPIRRTEKFFAATASGRWILKTDYLSASSQAGKFLAEEPYEWNKAALSEDGAINLEAPRKWRLLRERTGHGAFYGMRLIIYGECITPPLDTLKRVVKAGDGTILATSPPYTRFLTSGVDYAVVSPGMPRVDMWVQEFIKHEIPCIVADYLVEYVCKPGYPLERHVLYNTNEWAKKSFAKLSSKAVEILVDLTSPDDCTSNDVACQVCGCTDRGEVMLICGDESGSVGCGLGMHIDCCDPPLEGVPEGDWFCPKCSSRSESKCDTNPAKKRRKATSLKKK